MTNWLRELVLHHSLYRDLCSMVITQGVYHWLHGALSERKIWDVARISHFIGSFY